MRIALIGYGKMGREIEAAARAQGLTISAVFDIDPPVTAEGLAESDVCIEFTHPGAAASNIRVAAAAGKSIVVGTTGWLDALPSLRPLFTRSALLYSSNFSLGMNLFFRMVRHAATLVNSVPAYDVFIHEAHHRHKADSPSGTALRLGEILLDNIERKSKILGDAAHRRIEEDELHVSSVRAGTFAGTHTVGFDSAADTIELTHTAKSREGFALGALTAARWVHGKTGVYTMDDVEL